GVAGHASMPKLGDNALLKLAPVLSALAPGMGAYDATEVPLAMIAALGEDASDPALALERLSSQTPILRFLLEPLLAVTMTPTMIHASDKMNVIPAHAHVKVDTRVPPGLGADVALQRMRELLGDAAEGIEIEFTEEVFGYASPARSPLMDAIDSWITTHDPGTRTVPTLLAGYSDSSYFRAAFPDLIAYGFFPHRHQTMLETAPLIHNADERIDVRDLGYAARFYSDIAAEMLG
ncbi:MAG TPA: peptidase dimerization domain-containing protein, partial [Solirubrobacteraceae bacterium]|nr:peptidase dimerization domain-containing protein [Solirubrobacteraceae bacterium]